MKHPNFRSFKATEQTWSTDDEGPSEVSIFLAGSIDMGKAQPWQAKMEESLSTRAVSIFNPRRDDFDPKMVQDISDPDFKAQVDWELDHIEMADFVLFYFDPNGMAPITLMELGIVSERVTNRENVTVYVACPEGYWRRGNVQVVCERSGIPVLGSLEELAAAIHKHLDRWEVDDIRTWEDQ